MWDYLNLDFAENVRKTSGPILEKLAGVPSEEFHLTLEAQHCSKPFLKDHELGEQGTPWWFKAAYWKPTVSGGLIFGLVAPENNVLLGWSCTKNSPTKKGFLLWVRADRGFATLFFSHHSLQFPEVDPFSEKDPGI